MDIKSLDENKLLEIIPELNSLKGIVENNEWHDHDDVFIHTMTVFKNVKKNLQLKFVNDRQVKDRLNNYLDQKIKDLTKREILLWAGLLHDIAKPQTLKKNGELDRCPGHESEGAVIAKKICTRLKFSEANTERLYNIVYNHSVPHKLLDINCKKEILDSSIGHSKKIFQDIFIELLILGLSDTEGSQLRYKDPHDFGFRITHYHTLLNSY